MVSLAMRFRRLSLAARPPASRVQRIAAGLLRFDLAAPGVARFYPDNMPGSNHRVMPA
jgi:hypothetical protein